MRSVLSLASVALLASLGLGAGCLTSAERGADFAGDDDVRGAGQCVVDADCTLAGPSCCECPTFAVEVASGWADACDQVACPEPAACPALEARCDQGACVAACAPVACDLSCADGFALDAAGCTVCACASGPAAPACQVDADCVRVPADCCGCASGGVDVAVPVAEAGAFVDALGCSGDEVCPGVSTCDAAAVPRCLAGRCDLTSSGAVPPPVDGGCGRPDQPPCPTGQVCVINGANGEAGTGRCQAP